VLDHSAGLDIIESCVTCKLRSGRLFCNLPEDIVQAFESLRTTVVYPRGSILFVEGQSPRGVYLICTGRAKLSTSAADGKTLIVQIAEAGEVLGASAAICGGPHEVTATLEACGDQEKLEEALKGWLKSTIAQIEQERAERLPA